MKIWEVKCRSNMVQGEVVNEKRRLYTADSEKDAISQFFDEFEANETRARFLLVAPLVSARRF